MKNRRDQEVVTLKQTAKMLQQELAWEAASAQWKKVLDRAPDDQEALRALAYCFHLLGYHDSEQSVISQPPPAEPVA